MPESFVIAVHYNNNEIELEGEFRQWGYSYQLAIVVDGTEIIFEPDEERNLRAVVYGLENSHKPIPRDLVKLIGEKLEEIFR